MPSTTLATAQESLPALDASLRIVTELAHAGNADALSETRIQADAHRLYAERAGHHERARHFAILKLVAEAGLGVLSYEHSDALKAAVPSGNASDWRALAAAAERRQLLHFLEDHKNLSTTNVAAHLRWEGWTTVQRHRLGVKSGPESVKWGIARRIIKEKGIDPASIPLDASAVRAQRSREVAASRRMQDLQIARRKADLERMRAAVRKASWRRGQKVSNAFGLFRRAYQSLDQERAATDNDMEREYIDLALAAMDRAEECIAIALGIHPPPEDDRTTTIGPTVKLVVDNRA